MNYLKSQQIFVVTTSENALFGLPVNMLLMCLNSACQILQFACFNSCFSRFSDELSHR